MKRIFFLFVVCVIALPCGISRAGIAGTPHDLTRVDSGGNFSFYATEQVCVFCHTPHGARTDVSATTYWDGGGLHTAGTGGFLLWNRALPGQSPGDPTVTGFSMYTSDTMKVPKPTQLNIYTLLCMGCHDGVGALNVVNNYPNDIPDPVNGPIPDPGGNGITNISDAFPPGSYVTSPNIGELGPAGNPDTVMHLENDHPVSIDYTQAVSLDGSAFVNYTPDSTNGAHVGTDTRVRLFPNPAGGGGWFVECPTCHDVHNDPAGQEPFLVKSNAGSALCTTCHIK